MMLTTRTAAVCTVAADRTRRRRAAVLTRDPALGERPVILITGASTGIGAALARVAAQHGARRTLITNVPS